LSTESTVVSGMAGNDFPALQETAFLESGNPCRIPEVVYPNRWGASG
jgi:hypothetical protein